MSAAPWVKHFGLSRTPFGKSIAAKDLFVRAAHAEAVARINFCVVESALGVITGDVGAGKTVSTRAAVAGLDPTRHQIIYVANPAFGTRGLYVTIVRSLGAEPRYLKAELMAQAQDLLAAEEAERHRRVVMIVDLCRLRNYADVTSSTSAAIGLGGLREFKVDLIVRIVTGPPGMREGHPKACNDQA